MIWHKWINFVLYTKFDTKINLILYLNQSIINRRNNNKNYLYAS